jgi:hypothetical protein
MGKGHRTRWGALAPIAALAILAAACGNGSPAAAPPSGNPGTPAPTGRPTPGARVPLGTAGPWAIENRVYAGPSGIRETFIVGVTTDEAQNRWIATPNALYLAPPSGGLWRFDEMDGLHLGAITGRTPGAIGWVKYCDNVPVAAGAPCTGETLWGGANSGGIRSIVGGGPNEVFVGYQGSHTTGLSCPTGPDGCDPLRHSGKIDRVRLNKDGSISVDRLDWFLNHHELGYWYNRTAYRLAYDHFTHPGTLYAGSDHGVIIFFPDRYAPYTGGGPAGLDAWLSGFAGDHAHATVCVGGPCSDPKYYITTAGHWRGLWIDPEGQLWHAGESSAGLIKWDSDPVSWWERWGDAFAYAFGWSYVYGNGDEPVFKVAVSGDPVNLTAVSTCPDGRTWFASEGPKGVTETVAVFDPKTYAFTTFDARTLGLPDRPVQDLVCLPDGRLVIAGVASGAVVYDPRTNASAPLEGIPSQHVIRLAVDTMVSPFALLVATDGGAAVLRNIP